MRLLSIALTIALLAPAARPQTAPESSGSSFSACSTARACGVSSRDFKKATGDFRRGAELAQRSDYTAALDAFESATNLVPRSAEFATAREVTRQRLVSDHIV